MNISIRTVCGKYAEVIVVIGETTCNLGLLDYREVETLSETLRVVCEELDELTEILPDKP